MKKRIFTVSLILALLLTLLTGCASKEETAQKNSLHIVIAAPFATEEQASALKDAIVSTATHFVLCKYKDKGIIYGTKEVDERGNSPV